jgi:hypothetical protein
VLEDALACFEHQIEAVESTIALFQAIDDAQALQIVFEAAMALHAFIERVLPGVAEGSMTKIVCQRDGFGKIVIETQGARHRAGDLRDLDAVRQARSKQVAFVIHEDLGLVFEAAKGGGMNDPVPVALEFTARLGARFGKCPAATVSIDDGIGRQFRHRSRPRLRLQSPWQVPRRW